MVIDTDRARVAQWVRLFDYLTIHTSLSPIRHGFAPSCVNYKKGCTPLTAASDKVYQLLAHGLWFFPGTPASSTTKTGRHDIAEILLNVALNTIQSINQSINQKLMILDTRHYNISGVLFLFTKIWKKWLHIMGIIIYTMTITILRGYNMFMLWWMCMHLVCK